MRVKYSDLVYLGLSLQLPEYENVTLVWENKNENKTENENGASGVSGADGAGARTGGAAGQHGTTAAANKGRGSSQPVEPVEQMYVSTDELRLQKETVYAVQPTKAGVFSAVYGMVSPSIIIISIACHAA